MRLALHVPPRLHTSTRTSVMARAVAAILPFVFATALAHAQVGLNVVLGRAVGEHGDPVANAAVVTSACGQPVTCDDGSFEISFALPAGANHVQITAVSNGTGSSRIGSLLASGLVPGGTRQA